MSKGVVLGLSGVAGVVLPSTVTAYHQTQSTIWDKVKDDAIPNYEGDEIDSSLMEAWTSIGKDISARRDVIKDSSLKSLLLSEEETINGEKIKSWCFEKYKEVYWNWFQKENSSLKDDVEFVCIKKISDQLDSKNRFVFSDNNENEANFKKKIKQLERDNGTELDLKLKKVRENKDSETNWKELEEWCKDMYNKGFQGEKTTRWKLVQLYCKKEEH